MYPRRNPLFQARAGWAIGLYEQLIILLLPVNKRGRPIFAAGIFTDLRAARSCSGRWGVPSYRRKKLTWQHFIPHSCSKTNRKIRMINASESRYGTSYLGPEYLL